MNPAKRTYFLSDMHLGARYLPDSAAQERRVVAFLREIAPTAEAVYLLGDVLDYWFEYRNVVPRGYVRFFGQLASMADAGIRIVWFTGNHDIWLFDYLRSELGIEIVDTPAEGGIIERIGARTFCLTHGDTFGPQPWVYMMLRRIFRNRLCQWLFAGIHPRWTVPFAHRWSSDSRKKRRGKARKRKGTHEDFVNAQWRKLEAAGGAYAAEHPEVDYIVMGHYHLPLDLRVGEHCRLIVLGDWIYNDTYAVFDGEQLELKRYGRE